MPWVSVSPFGLLFTASLLLLPSRCQARQLLYYASPGDGTRPAGLWVGFIDPRGEGQAYDLSQVSHRCMDMPTDRYYPELNLQGMSFDPLTYQAVLELDGVPEQTSALLTPICSGLNSCQEEVGEALLSLAETEDHLQAAKLGPYAFWNEALYFVSRRYYSGDGDRSRVMRMEIRRLTNCRDQWPFTARSRINLDTCSEVVATLYEETHQHVVFAMRETVQPSDHLLVIGEQEFPIFFIQLYDTTYEDDIMTSYRLHLMVATQGSVARVIHTEDLPLLYTWHILSQMGGITYRDDVLCWSAIDRVLCGDWSVLRPEGMRLEGVRLVLPPGQASQVCTGTTNHPIYANITSGLALAEVSETGLSLYFGCYASLPEVGGAGLLKVSRDWDSYTLYPLRDGEGPIHAGSMFVAEGPLCDSLYEDLAEEGHDLNSPVALQDPTSASTQREEPGQDIQDGYTEDGGAGGDTGGVEMVRFSRTVYSLLLFLYFFVVR